MRLLLQPAKIVTVPVKMVVLAHQQIVGIVPQDSKNQIAYQCQLLALLNALELILWNLVEHALFVVVPALYAEDQQMLIAIFVLVAMCEIT